MAYSKLLHHHLHHDQVSSSGQVAFFSSKGPKTLSSRLPFHRHLITYALIRSCSISHNTYLVSTGTLLRRRPVVILPGLCNNSQDYAELICSLKERGLDATVAEVSRPDWLKNAKGFLDRKCWSGELSPRPILDWYFEKMKKAIDSAKETAGGDTKVSLLGHSAGGWLARMYMLEFGVDDISMLLSLGTPHLPPPKGIPGVIDQTGGLLDYLNSACPGDSFAPHVKYVCVAGRFLKGERIFPLEERVVATTEVGTIVSAGKQRLITAAKLRLFEGGKSKQWVSTLQACAVGQSYKQVCGQADVWGDGVVPVVSSHLQGARNITLDGVYHSMLGAKYPDRPWYGSPGILDLWVHCLE